MARNTAARRAAWLTAALVCASALLPAPAFATDSEAPLEPDYVVTSAADDPSTPDLPGTLRAVISQAAAERPDDTSVIGFDVPGNQVVVTSEIAVESHVVLQGDGETQLQFAPADSSTKMLSGYLSAVGLDGMRLVGDGSPRSFGLWQQFTAGDTMRISDTVFEGFGTGYHQYYTSTPIVIERSEFTNNHVGASLDWLSKLPVTFSEVKFLNNQEVGASMLNYTAFTPDGGVHITNSTFEGNGVGAAGATQKRVGGLDFQTYVAWGSPTIPPLHIEDSTFIGNHGREAGALSVPDSPRQITSELPSVPFALITGSTFVDNIGSVHTAPDPQGRVSSDIALIGFDLDLATDAEAPASGSPDAPNAALASPTHVVLGIQNSTFDGTAARDSGRRSTLVRTLSGYNTMELEHVTAVNSGLAFRGFPGEESARISRSVLGTGPGQDPVITFNNAAPTLEASDSAFTEPSAFLDLTAGTNRILPFEDYLLGPVADNGGPTQTRIPDTNSPLIDAVSTPGSLTTDQRGFLRPAGPAADIGAVEVPEPTPPVGASLVSLGDDVRVATTGDPAVFHVERTGDLTFPLSVVLATTEGSARAGTDYTHTEATVSWDAAEGGAQTFTVPTIERSAESPELRFGVTLAAGENDPAAKVEIGRDTAAGILPPIAAVTPPIDPPVTPPVDPPTTPSVPDTGTPTPELATTGSSGVNALAAIGVILTAGGVLAWASRLRARNRSHG